MREQICVIIKYNKLILAYRQASKSIMAKESKSKEVGSVVHFFSNIKVAVIKLSAPLAVGDEINIVGGENTDFKQPVKSMESDHAKVTKAKKGDEVGLKVKKKVREGYKVYKV